VPSRSRLRQVAELAGSAAGAERATPVEAVLCAGSAGPRVSIIVLCKDEGETIVGCLDRICEQVHLPAEILVVFDSPDDTTAPYAHEYAKVQPRVRPVLNELGPGPAWAIRAGFRAAAAPVVVVTMSDGSDDAGRIDDLTRLVERGVVIAAASRYSRGGQQVGGSLAKRVVSQTAGRTLYHFARVGTRDATNSFKAYSKAFVDEVGIDSEGGFEVAIELVAKARRRRAPIAELPTIWLDRQLGVSKFELGKWLPKYIRWYFHAFGPRLGDRGAPPKQTKRNES